MLDGIFLNNVSMFSLQYDQRSLAMNEFDFVIYEKYKLYMFLKIYFNSVCLWNTSLKIVTTLPESTTLLSVRFTIAL
jgi:hypothetical protein